MDRLEAMSVFVTAVEAGSLSAAGRRLGIPLPTVSRRLSELEAHLNTRLLVRSTRSLSLTEAGAAYLTASRRILEEVQAAEQAAAGEYGSLRGELTVAAPVVFGRLHVLPVVAAFLSAYPDIRLRLMLADRNSHLIDEHVDVAVRIGRMADSSMVAIRTGAVRRVVCGSPAYLAQMGEPQTLAELDRLACIAFDFRDSPSVWTFARPGSVNPMRVAIRPRLSVTTAEAAIDAAIAGLGITQVLSYQAANAVFENKLKVVLQPFEIAPIPVSLIHAGGQRVPLKTRAFLDMAAKQLKERLARIPALQAGPIPG